MSEFKYFDFIDSSFDHYFDQISNLFFYPFIGKEFTDSKQKLLIVGESVYNWESDAARRINAQKQLLSKHFVRKTCIEQGLKINSDKNYHRFYRNIELMHFGKKIDKEERGKFWKSVCFHEFVLEPMQSIIDRPTEMQYVKGAEVLIKIINLLKIEKVYFLGSEFKKFETIRNELFKNNFSVETFERKRIGRHFARKRIIKRENNYSTTIYFVKHPSAFFSAKKWHQFVKEEQ